MSNEQATDGNPGAKTQKHIDQRETLQWYDRHFCCALAFHLLDLENLNSWYHRWCPWKCRLYLPHYGQSRFHGNIHRHHMAKYIPSSLSYHLDPNPPTHTLLIHCTSLTAASRIQKSACPRRISSGSCQGSPTCA